MLKIVISANYTSVIVRRNGGFQECTEFTLSLGFDIFNFPEETIKVCPCFSVCTNVQILANG